MMPKSQVCEFLLHVYLMPGRNAHITCMYTYKSTGIMDMLCAVVRVGADKDMAEVLCTCH